MKDLTGEAPVRRMTVARGRLTEIPDGARKADVGAVEAVARLAVKAAHHALPDLHPCSLGHVGVDLQDDDGITATVTVQAHARAELEGHAMHGLAVALVCLREQVGGGRLEGLHVVQNVG